MVLQEADLCPKMSVLATLAEPDVPLLMAADTYGQWCHPNQFWCRCRRMGRTAV
ncbi:MAG: hypothetical protein GDA36_06225 [Rhodobacteraceae bacterium]|nr:hypothetical protein [Paracoccaceae bacterium]